MRHPDDNVTGELPGVPAAKERKPRAKLYASDAEKQAAYRARKRLVARTIHLPEEVNAGLNAVLEKKGQGVSEVLTKLIQSQLLRKR